MKEVFFAIVAIGLLYMGAFTLIPQYDPETEGRIVQDKINEYRIEAGREPLTWDDELEKMAIAHSQWMNDTGRYEHSNYSLCENILEGGVYPEKVAEIWKDSPAHNLNMTSSIIHRGAVGIVGKYATFLAW